MTTKTDARLKFSKFVVYFALIALLAGCASFETLPGTDAQSLASQIEVGDKIKIMRNDDTDVTFKVSDVSDEGISDDGVFVAYSDIRWVQVSEQSIVKSVGMMVGMAVVFLALIISGIDK